MNLKEFMFDAAEKPLDRILPDGGFTSIFRTVGCIGDSLSSGEFELVAQDGKREYMDFYEYSWGQYMARAAGIAVRNFSEGGMTAKRFWNEFSAKSGCWEKENLCGAYIVALGVNDLLGQHQSIGSPSDICLEDYNKNADTFCGYYGRILQKLRELRPETRLFLMTMPKENEENQEREQVKRDHAALLHGISGLFDNTYVLDFNQYAPRYDGEFKRNFYLNGHMNPMGYILTAKMVMSYIDYIIRQSPEDFVDVGVVSGCHRSFYFAR